MSKYIKQLLNKDKPGKSGKPNKSNKPPKGSSNPSNRAKDDPQHYRHIPPGTGGTYRYSNTGNDSSLTKHVGMTGCSTSVGVYFKIDEQRFFAAHIVGTVDGPTGVAVNTTTGAVIKTHICALLDNEATNVWQNVTSGMRESIKTTLVMVCSRRADPNGALASEYVQQAVNEWVQTTRIASPSTAMVVDHKAGSPPYVGDDPSANGWVQVLEPSNGVWQFQIMHVVDPESNILW